MNGDKPLIAFVGATVALGHTGIQNGIITAGYFLIALIFLFVAFNEMRHYE